MKRNDKVRNLQERTFSGIILLSFLFTIFGSSWSGFNSSEPYAELEINKAAKQSQGAFFQSYSPETGDGILLPEEIDSLEELRETNEKENKKTEQEFAGLLLNDRSEQIIEQNEALILSNQDYISHSSRSLIILYHAWKGFIA